MGNAFDQNNEFERRAAGENEIERAVFVVGGKQPIQRKQAR